MKNYRA